MVILNTSVLQHLCKVFSDGLEGAETLQQRARALLSWRLLPYKRETAGGPKHFSEWAGNFLS